MAMYTYETRAIAVQDHLEVAERLEREGNFEDAAEIRKTMEDYRSGRNDDVLRNPLG
jgi:hypothetical protein